MTDAGLTWANVRELEVGDTVATLQPYQTGARLDAVARKAGLWRARVVGVRPGPRDEVNIDLKLGMSTISRGYLPTAILAIDKRVSVSETELTANPNRGKLESSPNTETLEA